jgi:aldose sugar dehydrogenase
MVFLGFNSGWYPIQGYMDDELMERDSEDDQVYFGNYHYADHQFVWTIPIGITVLKFLNLEKLGQDYANKMFVGNIITVFYSGSL